ncbi:16S rRNA (guanine(527)-N(7))-methyltransferase RsmG [Sphingomonas sp. ID0503]|uniref:16S rRNA (guanine(527)-N(7))-methyltransferase RsmG n=1 Tax=Sphingomonas sp. ID0503 TaxID=3399691 RepID=UPI003AFA4190
MQNPLEGSSNVPRETGDQLAAFVGLLLAENQRQNLIARSTESEVWQRHIEDCTQLIGLAPEAAQSWLDIGSGPGLPGMVVAIARPQVRVTLCEPRRRRVEFLQAAVDALNLKNVQVAQCLAERLPDRQYDVISARAVASLDALLQMGLRLSTRETYWLLPKGRSAAEEMALAEQSWHGRFRLVASVTSSDAAIVVADGVTGRRG